MSDNKFHHSFNETKSEERSEEISANGKHKQNFHLTGNDQDWKILP